MHRVHIRHRKIHHDQICAITFLQRSTVAAPLRLCTAQRRCPDHLFRRHCRWIIRRDLSADRHQLHFLHEVETVVAGHAIGANRNLHAFTQQFSAIADPAVQLHIADRIYGDCHSFAPKDLQILLRRIDTMSCNCRHIEDPAAFQIRRRRFSMTPNAFFMLLFRLRYMHLHPRIDAACVISQRTCGCRIRSVFRVKAHIHQDPPVFGSIVISVKILRLLHAHKAVGILPCDVGDGSCNISLRPAVCKSPGHIIAEIIHIACGHDPESERFCQSQHSAPVNGIAIQFRLKREDFLVEPVLQFQIFSISTHKRHW